MTRTHAFRVAPSAMVIAVWASLGLCALASGSVMLTPVSQSRGVSGFVIVPPCGPPTSAGDSEAATDFAPFDAEIDVSKICSMAIGIAQASQQSQIGTSSMSAVGSAAPAALSKVGTVIHAMPSSTFEVTFEIASPARFSLAADLSASGELPVVISHGQVRLTTADGADIVDQTVEPGAGGTLATLKVAEQAILAPGTYTLHAEAISWIDASVPPSGDGTSAYDVSFELFEPADVDLDGDVDGIDLALLLGAWGNCPLASICGCPADLDCSGVINGVDLAILLGSWE